MKSKALFELAGLLSKIDRSFSSTYFTNGSFFFTGIGFVFYSYFFFSSSNCLYSDFFLYCYLRCWLYFGSYFGFSYGYFLCWSGYCFGSGLGSKSYLFWTGCLTWGFGFGCWFDGLFSFFYNSWVSLFCPCSLRPWTPAFAGLGPRRDPKRLLWFIVFAAFLSF